MKYCYLFVSCLPVKLIPYIVFFLLSLLFIKVTLNINVIDIQKLQSMSQWMEIKINETEANVEEEERAIKKKTLKMPKYFIFVFSIHFNTFLELKLIITVQRNICMMWKLRNTMIIKLIEVQCLKTANVGSVV